MLVLMAKHSNYFFKIKRIIFITSRPAKKLYIIQAKLNTSFFDFQGYPGSYKAIP